MRRRADTCKRLRRSPRSLWSRFKALDPEPVIAILEPLATIERQRRIRQVLAARIEAVTVMMDAPHDPHNCAAVLRSCDAFGVGRLHVVERAEPFMASNAVAKGAERWVEVVTHATAPLAVESVSRTGHRLIATHPDGEILPEELAAIPNVALVLGNEHGGVGADLMAACTGRVRVPMRGFVESLNVSVSAAILLCFATVGRAGDLPEARQRQLYARALVVTVPRARDILEANGVAV
jgi:tRNA (guanosine-2'-O-)-methyltransferase